MKKCPVCASTLFDDMPTCFGCLYQFGSDPALEERRSTAEEKGAEAGTGGQGRPPSWAPLVGEGGARIPLAAPFRGPAGPGIGEGAVEEMQVPGWVVRVKAGGSGAADTSLTIEIEPTQGVGSS